MISGLRRGIVSVAAAVALLAVTVVSAAQMRPFDAKSLDSIRAARAGKPFVLAFWSIHCEPCREEMTLWKTIQRKHPELSIVLVATDSLSEQETMKRFLALHDPGPVETWVFADEFSERVRYAVDRTWRGELPRTYFFDSSNRPQVRSGRLDSRWVEEWIARQMPTSAIR